MITPQEYRTAKREIERLNRISKDKLSKLDKLKTQTENRYYRLERTLRNKKEKELNKITKQRNKIEEKRKLETEPLYKKWKEFNRIIQFIETSKKERDLNIEVYNYDYPKNNKGEVIRTKNGNYPEKEKIYINPISILKDDNFYKIAIYIYNNRKPKNKYTLCVIGRSIFDSKEILSLGRGGYLSDINENGNFKGVLKELPEKKDLIDWFKKNKNKVFKEQIKIIEEVIKEYQGVLRNINSNKWEIAYLENKKDYYENHYSGGIEKQEYLEVIYKLIKLTKGKERERYSKIIKNRIIENLK